MFKNPDHFGVTETGISAADYSPQNTLKGGDLRYLDPQPLPYGRYQVNFYLSDGTLIHACHVHRLSDVHVFLDFLTEDVTDIIYRELQTNTWHTLNPKKAF